MMRENPEREYALVSQASHQLRISEARVRQLVDAGKLKAVRGPRGIRLIDRLSLEKLAAERRGKADAGHAE